VEPGCEIGTGSKFWHFAHVLAGSRVGENCTLGQNVSVGPGVTIGHNVKIQNNVSVCQGGTLEDDVFAGPSCVFTNVPNPRSHISRKHEFRRTWLGAERPSGQTPRSSAGARLGGTPGWAQRQS